MNVHPTSLRGTVPCSLFAFHQPLKRVDINVHPTRTPHSNNHYNYAMALIAELRRRNIFKVALLYLVAGWVFLQLAGILFGPIGVPDWVFRFSFGMLVICFPLMLVFSWIFELTPQGIKRESEIQDGESITHRTGRRINRIIVILLILAIALTIVERLIPEQGSAGNGPAEETTEPAALESAFTVYQSAFVQYAG